MSEFSLKPLKTRVSVSTALRFSQTEAPLVFKGKRDESSSSQCRILQAEGPDMGLRFPAPQEDLHCCDVPPAMVTAPGVWVLPRPHLCPLLPVSMWPLLYILSCRKSVLLVFMLFSERVVYVVVVLVCL